MSKCPDCGVEIMWLTSSFGKRAPVEVEPSEDGNIIILRADSTFHVLSPDQARQPPRAPRHKLHWAHSNDHESARRCSICHRDTDCHHKRSERSETSQKRRQKKSELTQQLF